MKNFSLVAAPLYALMKKDVEFAWIDDCQVAFEELKDRLINGPILALPQDEGQYVLDTDASDFGLGAVLSQMQRSKVESAVKPVERVIAYTSRTLSKLERKYETTRKELLAVGLRQHKQYLLGRKFVI